MRLRALQLALAALPIALGGCGGEMLPPSLGAGLASTHAEPPVEIYSRIARGALVCWFGVHGSLKRTHIFHADVAPPAAGGGAEISVQERDPSGQSPRSLRAFRIAIEKSGDGSSVTTENFRLPASVADPMIADVRRWASGKTGCSVVGAGGWTAEAGKEEPPAAPAKKPK